MLRLRLKRGGKKRNPIYRIVIMNNTTKRDGKTIEEVGFYNPITKQIRINVTKVITRLKQGVQPSNTVRRLLVEVGIITY
jgi:small subunit ribosomal protein S16|tara:strand:- start:18953 stop:19192 length:240 start_codon:yes stop_codon:yes gene_type:complete